MDSSTIDLLLKQIQYKGMPKPESDITRAWLRLHAHAYDAIDFNVRLGAGQDIQPGIDAATAAQYSKISRKRADIVATAGKVVDIIEVKPAMSFAGVGQLVGYKHLWEENHPSIAVRRLIAVAQIIDPEVKRVLQAQHCAFEVVQPEPLGFGG